MIKIAVNRALSLRRAINFVWQSGSNWMIASVVLVVFQAILPAIALYIMKRLIDSITAGQLAIDSVGARQEVTTLIILAGVVTLAGSVLRSLSAFVTEAQGQSVSNYMQDLLHEQSIAVDLEYYENPAYYDTLHRAQREAPFRPLRIVNGITALAQNALSLVAIGGIIVLVNPIVAVLLILSTLPAVYVRMRYSNRIYRWNWKQAEIERRYLYYDWMLIDSGHAKEIRLFELGKTFIERARDLRLQLYREKLRLIFSRTGAEIAAYVFSTLAMYVGYASVAFSALSGTITLGDVVMLFTAIQRGQTMVQDLLGSVASLYEDSLFLTNLYDFLDIEPKISRKSGEQSMPQPMMQGIEFKNVSFRYGDDAREALRSVDLHIPAGKITALVGENGSGKTTLIKLLCRLYEPSDGNITVDGINLDSITVHDLRSSISVIFQDFAHYNLSVSENIAVGNLSDLPDLEKIQQAARESGAHDLITSLKHDYDTILGRWFEEGVELSMGEWQKIALARALIRDSQIIILDEPTSAMDAKAEFELFEKIRDVARGRTVILISHRMSTVRLADYIYVLADGALTEGGTHDELLQRKGTYATLYQLQAQHFHANGETVT